MNNLKITNARENNLKNLDLEVPHDSFTVLTGLSGSGKSSLAFGTVYAEGQRRYIETFSPYTRQFFDKVKKPDVTLVENVRPAIAIQQRTRVVNSRSTVGSITNINDYLKILWSNLSVPQCPQCDIPLYSWNPETLSDHILQRAHRKPEVTFLLAAAVKIKSGFQREVERFVTLGYSRFLDEGTGEIIRADSGHRLPERDELIVVLDRVRGKGLNKKRLKESVEQAFGMADGMCTLLELHDRPRGLVQIINSPSQENRTRRHFTRDDYSNVPRCASGLTKLQKPRSSLFSFNHPLGACTHCRGFGNVLAVDLDLCIPDPNKTLAQKCIVCWSGESAKLEHRDLLKFCEKQKIPTNAPWRTLRAEHKELIIRSKTRDFWGILPWFEWVEKKTYKMHIRVFLSKYRSQRACPECEGTRLRRDALAYRIQGKTLPNIWQMPIGELLEWVREVQADFEGRVRLVRQIKDVFAALVMRLSYLEDLGLPYLTLDRQARTLSGGETQRVNLAAALGSDLVSTQFVLDEPSVGLHPRDTERLIRSVKLLHERGNSVLAVEHDPDFILAGERVIELGPASGEKGGEVTYQGTSEEWPGITFDTAIIQEGKVPVDTSTPCLSIRGASRRNIEGLNVDLPLERFLCLTGVSGSGKSTLVSQIVQQGFLHHKLGVDLDFEVTGFERFDQVLMIDQSPLAKSPRANIATYSGVWDTLRDMLASTEDAKLRALTKSSFSFNVNAGRCAACDGAGFIREDMQFLSDVYIPCEVCLGKRFQQTVLEVRTRGVNVDDLLNMSIERCAELFSNVPSIANQAGTLITLGLGHLTLGHPLSELSGGEAQRLKLVPFVEESQSGRSLLIFDEPTTGLHVKDVEKLIGLFRFLRDQGHSVFCVEHNLTLILAADWLVDLGPEGGKEGGNLVLEGTPEHFLQSERGYTSRYLREYFHTFYRRKHDAKASSKKRIKEFRARKADKKLKTLDIEGARVHNLKDISVSVPLQQVVALTGVSGSGKSSIAKDIIYAEGQRRYLDCLSPYARQFIKGLERPDVDAIHNIMPTICVYQHTFQPSALSTVATMSEVYNFLRLLYAKTATQYCPDHPQQAIAAFSAEQVAALIKDSSFPHVRLLSPIIKMKKGTHKAVIARALESEISEIRVDGMLSKPSTFQEGLEKAKAHSIDFVLAKFRPKNIDSELLQETVAQALALGGGELVLLHDQGEEIFSSERSCPICQQGFFKPDPEDLAFHSRRGRCTKCSGTGRGKKDAPCVECGGARIGSLGRNLRIAGKNIFEICQFSAPGLRDFIQSLKFTNRHSSIAAPILRELITKLETLSSIGLDYISLNRDCTTLSGGELQRLRLATAMGSPLSGVMYIFDEPSVGLHPFDNEKVINRLSDLKDRGNSLIVIEHDAQSILAADHIIEVGPGGGRKGGEIVFSGKRDEFLSSEHSETAEAIRSSEAKSYGKGRKTEHTLQISHGSKNTISHLDVTLPLHSLITVCGLSGSGKSSLVHGIIHDTLVLGKETKKGWQLGESLLSLSQPIDRILLVDQQPIGANSRSTPASYLKIWDDIRKLFAKTIEAKSSGWGPEFFSYNTGKGRCPECKGLGLIKLEMNFLANASVTCESCRGSRFGDDAESVHFLGLTVSEVLKLTFDEARTIFANHRKIHQIVRQACELGLDYLTLGQGSNTLSGGESQRIKLVSELSGRPIGHTLYILDEPTTGLHKNDVKKLMKTLHELVDRGGTVIVIEHDPDVIKESDHVIEMGPGAGPDGGRVIFQGTPHQLLKKRTPWAQVLSSPSAFGLSAAVG
jgi:excinuclease ABC subunit A